MSLSTIKADEISQKILSAAPSEFLGSLLAATPLHEINRGTEIAKYLKSQRAQDREYDRATLRTSGWGGDVAGSHITVPVDKQRYGHYVVDDFKLFETPKGDALVSATANHLSLNMYGTLDAEFLKVVNSVTPESTSFKLSTSIADPALVADASKATADFTETYVNQIVDKILEMEGMVNSERLTVPNAELSVLLSSKGYFRATKLYKTFTTQTVQAISSGRIFGERIGGVNFFKHPMLLQNYAKGLTPAVAGASKAGAAGINMDQDYDFSKLEAVILSNEAVALPWTIISVKAGQEPYTLNDGVVLKYKFGSGIVRGDLIATYHNAA